MIKKLSYFIFIVFLLKPYTLALGQLQGKVVSFKNYRPIEGVSVVAKSDQTITDLNGAFTLDIDKGEKVFFLHIAYFSDSIVYKNDTNNLAITLLQKNAEIDEVVIQSAIFQYSMRESPGSMNLISNNEFRYSNPLTMIEKLNYVPGIYVQSGTQNTNRLTIRGIGSRTPYSTNKVKLFYNEIPLTNSDGISAIEDIDLSMLSNIEVVKGPKSALYGAGLGGTILTYSKYDRTNFATTSYGSYNSRMLALKAGAKFKINSIQLYANGFQSDGYRDNNQINKYNFGFDFKRNHSKYQMHFTSLFISNQSQIPSSINYDTYINSPTNAASNWATFKGREKYQKLYTGLNAEFKLFSNVKNSITFYNLSSKQDEIRPFNVLTERVITFGLKEIVKVKYLKYQFQGGIDSRVEYLNWSTYEVLLQGASGDVLNDFASQRNQYDVFFLAGYKSNNFTLETGLTYNITSYTLNNKRNVTNDLSGSQKFTPILSPFLGLNYHPIDGIYFYTSFGHGFSHPSLEETLLPDGLINSGLRPEAGIQFDAGFRVYKRDRKLYIDVGGYQVFLNNMIVTKREENDEFYGVNAGKTNHTGIEISINYKFWYLAQIQKNLFSLQSNFTSSVNKFKVFFDGFEDHAGNHLPGIPEYSFTGTLKINLPYKFQTQFSYMNIGRQYLTDDNREIISGYNLVNFTVGKKIAFYKSNELELYFSANNVFNEKYASMVLVNAPAWGGSLPRYYYPGLPTNWIAGLSYYF